MASGRACLAPDLKGSFSFSPLSIMLTVGFSYMVLFCWGKFLLYLICSEVFFFFFYHKRVLNFVKSFSASIKMIMWLLSLISLMWHYHIISLHMWNHPWIPAINPTWSWCVILLLCSWVQFAHILLRIFASMFNLFHFLLKPPLPVRSFLTTIVNI